jgi:diphthamide synthase (EF-2-diphthine--ammonia ligase)
MDAKNILVEISEAFAHAKLEAVMIGNAAAAIQGAPVTTMDIDFCIRETDETLSKLSMVAKQLDAKLINYGSFFQIQAPERELYLDFICKVLGVKSFDALLKRSIRVSFDGCYDLSIALLEDIIRSKKLAGQDKDLAVLPILERTLRIKNEEGKRTKPK